MVLRTVEELRRTGVIVGGFVSREERAGGRRTGFIMMDLATGEQAYLARVGEGRPRVGKYVVLIDELDRLGVRAIRESLSSAEVVVIDEIGPMELLSQAFRQAVLQALNSSKPILATIHYRAEHDRFGRAILSRGDCQLVTVTEGTREHLPERLARLILELLRGQNPLFPRGASNWRGGNL